MTLASASRDGTVKLWEATPGDSDTLRGHNRVVNGLAFSSDSRYLISASYGPTEDADLISQSYETPAVKMWDVATGWDLSSALGNLPLRSALCADFSPDGKTLAIGATGSTNLVLWDMATRKPTQVAALPHEDSVREAVFSPDGARLATQTYTVADDGIFRLWDPATGQELIRLKGYGSYYGAVTFSPDGRTLAVPDNGDRAVVLWDMFDLCADPATKPITTLAGRHAERINAVAISPDGATLASAGNDTKIVLWDISGLRDGGDATQVASLTGHTSDVCALAFCSDGKTLASGGRDGSVRLWNLLLHEQVAVLQEHGSTVWDVAFSPDGLTLASSSFDSTIKLWRAATEHEIQSAWNE